MYIFLHFPVDIPVVLLIYFQYKAWIKTLIYAIIF